MKTYVCTVCGYEYKAGHLPYNFECPLCSADAKSFEELKPGFETVKDQ